jgi:hypothetical protein
VSSISEKCRAAIYTKTNVGAVVGSGKLSAIYADKAPSNVVLPYGVFNRQASSPITYAFGYTQVLEDDLWQLRVYSESQKTAEDLLVVWVNTLGNSLTISGNTVEWIAKVQDLPNTDQQQSDRYIYGRGALIRIASS